jgi:hypothetical protein
MADLAVAAPMANTLALESAAWHRGCEPAALRALESLARERADLERCVAARPEGNVWDAIAEIPTDTERIVSGHAARMARRARTARMALAARIAARPKRDSVLTAPHRARKPYVLDPSATPTHTPTYPSLPAGSYAHFVASLRRAASTSGH